MEYLQELLRAEPKVDDAFQKLQVRYQELVREKERYRLRLNLLEQAIQHDYDSMMIFTSATYPSEHKIVYVNDAFSEMTGYNKEEIIGRSPLLLQGPETNVAVLKKLHERMRSGQSFSGETVNYRKDRSEFILQWDVHPLTDTNGRIAHWISYQKDISRQHVRSAFENRPLPKCLKSLSELQIAAIDKALSPNIDHPLSKN